jgi:putative Mg2+ transporter-C (MgtC) family protein
VPSNWDLLVRIAVGFGLAFAIGFERELRGAPAGDRTFSLVGGTIAGMTAILWRTSPQAVAGALTGIGFIGAGVVLQSENAFVRGITTAAAIFAAAAVGIIVGTGYLLLGTITTAAIIVTLELRNLPVLKLLDARRYSARFRNDFDPPSELHHRRGHPDAQSPPAS